MLLAIVCNLLTACDGLDENYSTNPSHRLSFSADTLAFDTVFTTVGSATKQFMVYNHNDQPLLIGEVMLAGSGQTGFRINVDGRKGDHFRDIRIQAKDSLFIFVEVTVNPNSANQPLLINDSILFSTNGINQSVLLEAYGQDVNIYKGGVTLTKDTRLTAERPYLIYDSLVVAEGATLDIEEGVTFYMHDKANIISYGKIRANGTFEKPIVFRGDRLDFILNDVLPYDRTPSQWGGVFFRPDSYGNVMNYVIIRNGTTGLTFDESFPEQSKLKISNSQITNMGDGLFSAFNCNIEATNSEFSNTGGAVVALIGGKYQFIHCTLANHITLTKRTTSCLLIANNANDKEYPLVASFDNCIIDGSFDAGKEAYKGEIGLSDVMGTEFDYRFNHCIIKSIGENNDRFKDVIFTRTSPSYRLKGGEKNKYRFDFRPDSLSTLGVGKADIAIAHKHPTDRLGVSRLANEGPDIGAYEFIPKEEEK